MSRSLVASLAVLAVLAALALALSSACAQDAAHPFAHHMATPLPKLAFTAGVGVVELPFTESRNHIVVEATLEGRAKLPCTLDTGARGTVVFGDSLVRALGLQPMGEALMKGAGGGAGAAIHGSVYTGVRVGLGGVTLSDLMLVSMPDSSARSLPFRGSMAIGRGLWEQVVAEIDWNTHLVRLHDPATWRYEGHGAIVPLDIDATGQPYVTARVALPGGEPFDATLVLDTGASHALQLEPGTDPRIAAPRGAARRKIGHGATGQVWGAVGTATSVTFGGVTFRDLPVTFPDSSLGLPSEHARNGNLGSGLLRRFHVILDVPHKRMILEPGPHVHEPVVLPNYDGD